MAAVPFPARERRTRRPGRQCEVYRPAAFHAKAAFSHVAARRPATLNPPYGLPYACGVISTTPHAREDARMAQPVIIENDAVQLEVWPHYGGKVSSLIDKADGTELLFSYPMECPSQTSHYDVP